MTSVNISVNHEQNRGATPQRYGCKIKKGLKDYQAVVTVNRTVVAQKWFSNYSNAIAWAESYEGPDYTIAIFHGMNDIPVEMYERISMYRFGV